MTASTTLRLGLTKPDFSDTFDLAQLWNNNADNLDAKVGFLAATSGTRPSSPYNGQAIRETDTGKYYVSNGSSPASASWTQLYGAGADFTSTGNVTLSGTGSNLSVGGSASITGVLGLGADVNIYRGAANVLSTDDALNIGGTMGLLGGSGALLTLANATTAPTGTPSGIAAYASGGGLFVRDGSGYVGAVLENPNSGAVPSGALAETVPRWALTTAGAPASGTLYLTALWLQAGQKVSNVSFVSSAAASSPTHWWFAVLDKNLKLQGHTADQTTTAWAANTLKTLPLVTPYIAAYTGLHYVGYMMAATTAATVMASPAVANQALLSSPFSGPSSTGLTTPGTDNSTTYAAISSNTAFTPFYAYVS